MIHKKKKTEETPGAEEKKVEEAPKAQVVFLLWHKFRRETRESWQELIRETRNDFRNFKSKIRITNHSFASAIVVTVGGGFAAVAVANVLPETLGITLPISDYIVALIGLAAGLGVALFDPW